MQAAEGTLQDARRLFDATDYEGAEAALDRVIAMLSGGAPDAAARDSLAAAYELRARSRWFLSRNNPAKRETAEADFKALLALLPGYKLPADVSPPARARFEEIRRSVVGQVTLEVAPADAAVTVNGAAMALTGEPLLLAAGQYTIAASRAAHKPAEQSVVVTPGGNEVVRLLLERTSATRSIVTIPHGVEVIVNNTSRGVTEQATSQPPQRWVEEYKTTAFSRPLVLADLGRGTYTVVLRRECYKDYPTAIVIDSLNDVNLAPVRLEPAEGTIQVESTGAAAQVFLDGTHRGMTPLTLSGVCEGARTVELRNPNGRMVRRLDVKPGEKLTVRGQPKPAFAIVAVSGLRPQQRGGTDLRLEVERAFGDAANVTIFAPPAEAAEQSLKDEGLDSGWLAFDRARRPIGASAAGISEAGRQELSAKLARRFEVQGVAAMTVPGADPNEVLVTLLAAGSGVPDIIPIKLNDPQSTAQSLVRLNRAVPLYRPSIGVLAIDVLDEPGVVVAAVESNGPAATAGLQVGDVITAAAGRPVKSVAELNEIVGGLEGDRRVAIDYRDRTKAPKRATLVASLVPRVLATADRTQLFNKNVLDLKYRLATGSPADEHFVRLNLGIALMGVKAWNEAKSQLEIVRLSEGGGISSGTVHYLLGICYLELRQISDAQREFRAAAASNGLLTEEGPPVKQEAEAQLQRLLGTSR